MEPEWKIYKVISSSYVNWNKYSIEHTKCDSVVWLTNPFKYFCTVCKNRAPDWIIVQVKLLNEKT